MKLPDLFRPPTEETGTQTRTRLLGGVVAFLGFQVVMGMAALAWFTLPIIMGSGAQGGGSGFTGGPLDRWLVLLIYALAAVLGLIMLVAGAVQAITDRRAKPIVAQWLVLCATLAMLAGMGLGM